MFNHPKVLTIAAHPDDELLGCAGTVNRMVNNGCDAWALILSTGINSRSAAGESNEDEINRLRINARKSANIIGYKDIFFENYDDNRMDNYNLLDIIKTIESYVKKLKPQLIFTHHPSDVNIDHGIVNRAVITATRPIKDTVVKKIYTFETLSSTEWAFGQLGDDFSPDTFVDIKENLSIKTTAFQQYDSEVCDYPHPRSLEMIKILAQMRGSAVGLDYAEAFRLVREII